MSLFGGGSNAQTKTVASGISISSSVYGAVIPIIYGTQRCSGNLLWYGDFVATPQNSGGGKGGGPGGKAGGSTSYTYSAYLAMALCEGPVAVPYAAARFWANKTEYTWAYALAHNISSMSGANGQSPWGYLTSNHPSQAIGYSGLAYAYFQPADFGTSAQIQNYSFEVGGFGNGQMGTPDTDPAFIVSDLLTNEDYGVGFPSARVASLTVFSSYCHASGMLASLLMNTQQDAATTLNDLVQQCNSEFVWSGGQLTIVPYGDQALSVTYSSTTWTYTPPTAALYSLTDDDFINTGSGDPVQRQRARPSDRMNSVQLEWVNRSNQYAAEIVEVKDQAAIELYGIRSDGSKNAHQFCTLSAATMSATLQLQRQAVRNQYTFTLGWRYCLLDPMDIVEITDDALGLNQQWVRILSLEEDEGGNLAITAEEYLGGSGGAPLYAFQTGNPYIGNYNVPPGAVNQPVILEPPLDLFLGQPKVMIGVSGASANWGGCDIWMSVDGTNYEQIGRIDQAANMGLTTASLAIGADPDTTHALTVNLTESFGALPASSTATADNFTTSAWICNTDYSNGEMVGIGYNALTSAYNYELTGSGSTHTPKYLRRGQLATTIAAHASGSLFMLFDQNVFTLPLLANLVGVTLHFKFVSFNIYGAANESLGTVTDYTYVPVSMGGGGGTGITGTPAAPTGISGGPDFTVNVDGTVVQSIDLTWVPGTGANVTGQEVQWKLHSASIWNSAAVSSTATEFTLPGVASNTIYDFKVRSVSHQSTGVVYSAFDPSGTPLGINSNQNAASPGVPGAPTVVGDYGFIRVSWTPISDPDVFQYDIAVSTGTTIASVPSSPGNGGGFFTSPVLPTGVTGSAFVVPNLLTNTTYHVWVRSVNTSGTASSWSTSSPVTTTVVQDPAAWTGGASTSNYDQFADGTIVPYMILDWNASPDPVIDHYEVQWQQHSTGLWDHSAIVDISVTAYKVRPVPSGITWDARVRAIRTTPNGRVFSAWVTQNSVVTSVGKTSAPATVSGFTALGGFKAINMSWTAVADTDVAYYEIGYSTLGGTLNGILLNTKATNATYLQNLVGNIWLPIGIWLWVRAVNTSGVVGAWNAGSGAFPTTGGTHVFPIEVDTDDAASNAWTYPLGAQGGAQTGTGLANPLTVCSVTQSFPTACSVLVQGTAWSGGLAGSWKLQVDVGGASAFVTNGVIAAGNAVSLVSQNIMSVSAGSHTFNLVFYGSTGTSVLGGQINVSALMR